MFKRLVLLVVVLLILSGSAVYAADAPAMQWHKGFGTDRGDHVHYGMQTSDSGFIMTGETSESRRYSNMLLMGTSYGKRPTPLTEMVQSGALIQPAMEELSPPDMSAVRKEVINSYQMTDKVP